ncbi:hypothetical protein SAMN05444266_105438 [Chitinophaga jiangningensis]|uniref:Uncharacterized protein n=1 Tax=Chitinophaga jiangningensis TaxID=1419482 RepID=A0A1M7EH16_9BACT|nr:hypothetical protein SAMN05444266_105438 [Chitinophaga jiangningensis]
MNNLFDCFLLPAGKTNEGQTVGLPLVRFITLAEGESDKTISTSN